MSNDAFLWYNVGKWRDYGLAVPNWSDDTHSQNGTIRTLVSMIGRNLANIMWHPDSRLRTPPSINTLTRIHKLCTRARALLAARAIPANVLNMETAHALPSPEVHLVYPTPYFKVRNEWLKDYAQYILLAMTDAMQHQENGKPLEISMDFAGLIGQYVKRVYKRMAVDLFRVPAAEADKDDFTLSDVQLAAYNPSAWFTSTEMIDTVPDLRGWPTEDQLKVLTDGIPVTQLPELGPYPQAPIEGSATGTTATAQSDSFAPQPGA